MGTTAKTNKIIIGTTAKTNKIILYCMNLLMIFPQVIRKFSPVGLAAAVILSLLELYLVVFKSKENTPAAAYLSTLAFFDFWIYICIHFKMLRPQFDLRQAIGLFRNRIMPQANLICIVLLCFGIGLACIGFKKAGLSWFTGVAAAMSGAAVIMRLFLNFNKKFTAILIVVYVLITFFWTCLFQLSVWAAPAERKKNIWMGSAVFFATLFIIMGDVSVIQAFSDKLRIIFVTLPTGFFAWWKVIFGVIFLLGLGVVMCEDKEKANHIGIDSFTMVSGAAVLFSVKILMANYFIYNFILGVFVVISIFVCLKNEISNKKTMRLDTPVYLAAQTAVLVLAAKLFKSGLWLNVAVTFLFGMIFYVKYEKIRNAKHKRNFWIFILTWIAAETAAWTVIRSYAAATVIILAMIYLVAVIAVVILDLPRPDKISAGGKERLCVCICAVLLCLISMRSTIRVDVSAKDSFASVSIEAKGKENKIKSVQYIWKDYLGREVYVSNTLSEVTMEDSEEGSKVFSFSEILSKVNFELAIGSDALTIIVTDKYGFRTTRSYWYPSLL